MGTRTARTITDSEKSHYMVGRLGSRNAEERREAKDDFLRMSTENPALFHADLADIIRAVTGKERRLSCSAAVVIAAAYPAFRILLALAQDTKMPHPTAGAITMFLLVVLTGSVISMAALGQRRKRLAESITDIDDLNALPALIELLEFTKPAVRNAIVPPITHLLLRLRASDAHLLGFLHRTALARALSTPRSQRLPASFFVSILHAFDQIGDSQALPAAAWLAQGRGVAADNPIVQEAAQTCQSHLQERIRRQQAPYLLLRPSSASEASYALLRPVGSAPEAASHDELLRADSAPQGHTIPSVFRPREETLDTLPIRLQRYEGA